MRRDIFQVQAFHKAFNQPVGQSPKMLTEERKKLRIKLISEELEELKKALEENDLQETLDALVDLNYVVNGTIVELGVQWFFEAVFDEVHRSNMAKLGPDGKPIVNGKNGVHDPSRPMGKVLKPKDWTPPNLERFVK